MPGTNATLGIRPSACPHGALIMVSGEERVGIARRRTSEDGGPRRERPCLLSPLPAKGSQGQA